MYYAKCYSISPETLPDTLPSLSVSIPKLMVGLSSLAGADFSTTTVDGLSSDEQDVKVNVPINKASANVIFRVFIVLFFVINNIL